MRAMELTLGVETHLVVGSGTDWSADLLKNGVGEGTRGHSADARFLRCCNIWLCRVCLGKDFLQLWFQASMLALLVVLESALNSLPCAP